MRGKLEEVNLNALRDSRHAAELVSRCPDVWWCGVVAQGDPHVQLGNAKWRALRHRITVTGYRVLGPQSPTFQARGRIA